MDFGKEVQNLNFFTGINCCAHTQEDGTPKMCRFFAPKSFGQVPFCGHFQTDLYEDDNDCVLRCKECKEIFDGE